MRHVLTFMAVSFLSVSSAAGQLILNEAGDAPDHRVTVTMPGVYRAAVWQASGGGTWSSTTWRMIPRRNTTWCRNRGLFEIGWHAGAASKDRGVRDWPSLWHQGLKAQGRLEVIEQSPARVRVRADSVFTWWQKLVDDKMPVTAIYTFYPCGQIAVQVRVQQKGVSYTWSREYGPHLCFVAQKDQPERNPGYTFSTPTARDFQDGFQGPAEELVLAVSPKIDARFLLTVPVESKQLFDRHMRHDGRSVNWDRAGYGSNGVVMDPGYDSAACPV